MELIGRRVINEEEGREVTDLETISKYADPDSEQYANMLEKIRTRLNFTTLAYNRLDDMIEATGIDRSKLCTYCWDGRE